MRRTLVRRASISVVGLAMVAALVPVLVAGPASGATTGGGAVYTETNAGSGNAIVVFKRAADGTLAQAAKVSTGGGGTSSALGSQGAVILSSDGKYLFAVNAGTNTISSFAVSDGGLHLKPVDLQSSGGVMPVSLTMNGDALYVLNAMGVGNITGFRVGPDGSLAPLPHSTRPLSGPLVNPAEVRFNPAGTVLVVTERGTQRIDTYPVDGHGLAGQRRTFMASGLEPFGFSFDPAGHAIVSETFGGLPERGAASSYALSDTGQLRTISGTVRNGQTATCWVAVTPSGDYAYMSNTGSGTVSSYAIGSGGQLSLKAGSAANLGATSAPIDLDLDRGASHLYVVASGLGTVIGLSVGSNGNLTRITSAGSLPPSVSGLAAR